MPTREKKGVPISIRLRRDFEELLEMEAGRSGVSKTRMLEILAEEALKIRRYPSVVFRGPEHRRRASVSGTGMDVWEIVMVSRGRNPEEVMESHPSLTSRAVSLAHSYYEANPEEIEGFLEENSRPPEHWRKLHPELGITAHSAEEPNTG
ncbi:MAG: hypothetical protein H0U65_04180 [Rubrobacter sp.]|jgi:uncharacterized protein (DUF433 family)|nr:hypothetical protein [Rubrobacter sp.]